MESLTVKQLRSMAQSLGLHAPASLLKDELIRLIISVDGAPANPASGAVIAPPGKVYNPATGRWVKADGPVGRQILAKQRAEAARSYQYAVQEGRVEMHWSLPEPMEFYGWRDPGFVVNEGTRWVLPSSREFPSFINRQFAEFKLSLPGEGGGEGEGSSPLERGERGLYPHQLFIRSYLSPGTPYRGSLLFHGLGAGKTRTAIELGEVFRAQGIHVLILTPASLQGNFRREIRKWGGVDLRLHSDASQEEVRSNDRLIDQWYHFVNYNGNPLRQLSELGIYRDELTGTLYPPTNMLIIIEEVHNLIHRMLNPESKVGPVMRDLLMAARNCKFLCLSGTPMVDTPVELAMLFNLMRGPLQESSGGTAARVVRGRCLPEDADEFNAWFIEDTRRESDLDQYRIQHQTQFKRRIAGLVSYYQGAAERFPGEHYPILEPKEVPELVYVRMSDPQYEAYQKARLRENEEMKRKRRRRPDLNDPNEFKSSFRAASRMLGNYFFPSQIPRPKSGSATYFGKIDVRIELTLHPDPEQWTPAQQKALSQLIGHDQPLTEEDQMEYQVFKEEWSEARTDQLRSEVLSKFILEQIPHLANPPSVLCPQILSTGDLRKLMALSGGIVEKYSDAVQRVLSMMRHMPELFSEESMQIQSPKMWEMWKEVESSPGPVFIYSNYKTLEGVGIFAELLQAMGYEEFRGSPDTANPSRLPEKPRYAFYTGSEGAEREFMVQAFNHESNQNPERPGSRIRVILGTSAAAEGLSFLGIRKLLIMEPHWNRVRIDQVIGRTRRLGSHSHLPLEDRKVEVKMFLAVPPFRSSGGGEGESSVAVDAIPSFEAELATDGERLREEVTDLYLDKVALKKNFLCIQFQRLIKEAAVDCSLNEAHHRQFQIPCLTYPRSEWGKMMYRPDYRSDLQDDDIMVVKRPFLRRVRDPEAQAKLDRVLLLKSGKHRFYTKTVGGRVVQKELPDGRRATLLFSTETDEPSKQWYLIENRLVRAKPA